MVELIEPEDNLITIDLESRFYHIPIAEQDQKYFGIKWKGKYYVWCVFALGISCAPYFFYKILCPVIKYLRENYVRLANFVDDFLLMLKQTQTTDQIDFTLQTLQECGWHINWKKSALNPAKQQTFIGFLLSTDREEGPWIKVLPEKIRKLMRAVNRALSENAITARRLASIIGQCVEMTKAVIPMKLLLHNSYRVLATRDNWNAIVQLSEPVGGVYTYFKSSNRIEIS